MKTIQKIAQKVLKCKAVGISTVYVDKVIMYEWILFGKYPIGITFKTV